ncbi:MAG: hypothetical protein E5299_00123 [Burkholderia gladioli]|nr:MAG: hypothetical protein E5299_00123 [Burkholderia gladioli]
MQALLGVKTVYRLTLRVLPGVTHSLRDLAFPSLPVPNYTTLCRRAKRLMSNCRSFVTMNQSIWLSTPPV